MTDEDKGRWKKNPTDPYNRILRAARSGKGVRLTADDCHELSMDDAIGTRAQNLRCAHAPEDRHPTNPNKCRNCGMWVEGNAKAQEAG